MRCSKVETTVFLELLCIVAIAISFCAISSYAACQENERNALLVFKQDLIDPLDRLASWVDGGTCCDWTGVVCDNFTGHVLELHLGNPFHPFDDLVIPGKNFDRSRFGGKLNPSLLELKHLEYLDLSGNDFGGQIPRFLGSLQNLRHFNLSMAGFGGLFPPQLGNLTNLRYLDLHDISPSFYADDLQWLSRLVRLQYLDMSMADLSQASDWLQVINGLPSLIELFLSSCNLGHFPSLNKVNFSSLSTVDLSFNGFSNSIPSWVFSLDSMVYLDLSQNSFRGPLPNGLRNMSSLRFLSLASNNFNSSIPNWFYSFSHLENLNLAFNDLQGNISDDIGNLTSAAILNFAYNKIEGVALKSLASLCSLRRLYLSGIRLNQEVSEVLEALSGCNSGGFEHLFLKDCNISGHLTDQIARFKSLTDLYLSDNSISGPIPETLGSLTFLTAIELSNNLLNGSFPDWLAQLTNLRLLWIGDNSLEGVVSEVHFANVTKLKILEANGNKLVLKVGPDWVPPFQLGVIALSSWNLGPKFPPWLRFQRDYIYLDISSAGIIDTIPEWFWNLSSQYFNLNLSHNHIQGKVPEILNPSPPLSYPASIDLNSNFFEGPLPLLSSNVGTLDLSNNSFSGSISDLLCYKMGEPKSLQNLHMADNHLSGELPECWMNWPNLLSIDLKNNNLSGNIPSSMGSLSILQSLHLRKNKLAGDLPSSLQNCTGLMALDLGENDLVGSIPSWLGETLSKLIIVSLRSNNLQGQIPEELCALRFLTILDLAHNNLSGKIPRCFMNLTAMTFRQNSSIPIAYAFGHFGSSLETTLLVIKGILLEYSTTLRLVASLDLSDNSLAGEIPEEITSLVGLISLNFSTNQLSGKIPEEMGNMGSLESIDLSYNRLSGTIPGSMSYLTFLSYLNLAYNNLTGRIPSSTQLQSLDASNFAGNSLCGPPLTKSCSEDAENPSGDREEGDDGDQPEWLWVLVSGALGFVVGFWAFIGPFLFRKSWRVAYFQMLDRVGHRMWRFYVKIC